MAAIKISELVGPQRIDAECYRKEFLQFDFGKSFYPLKDLCLIRSGTTPPDRDNELKEGIVLLKTTDIRNNVLSKWDAENFYYISPAIDERMKDTQLRPEDVLINIVGATTDVIGRAAYVPGDFPKANITQAMACLRVTDDRLNPTFLFAFLSGKYGNKQIQRYARPTGQFNLNLQELGEFRITLPPKESQLAVEKLVKTAGVELSKSKHLYAQAQALLAVELGLDKVNLNEELYNVQRISDVKRSNRIDAEHFKPKYYRALNALKSIKPEAIVPLGSLVSTITNGHTPLHHSLAVGEIPFLTAEHIFDFRINFDTNKRITKEQHQGELSRTQLKENDVLITIKGRVGNVAIVEELPTPANINQDVALLRLNKGYHPYYIAGFLNSPVGKALTEQICTGQINPFLGLGNLNQIAIPILDDGRMNELGNKLQLKMIAAYQARQDAHRMLAEARAEVERMIEGER